MTSVTLRPASGRDWETIHAWLRQEEIQQWWGSLPAAEAEVRAALGQPMGLCSIILADGQPAGYVQAQDTDPRAVPGIAPATLAGTFRIDAFIGDRTRRAQGIGRQALDLATAEVFATTLTLAVIVIVPLRHEAAVRLYEKAGFAWQRVIDDPLLGPSWLMRRERAPR